MTTRGSKRIVYVCGDDPGAPLKRQDIALASMADMITASASLVATGDAALRLTRLSDFHVRLQKAMQDTINFSPSSPADD